MKRFFAILLIAAVCLCLSACDPASYYYYRERATEVVAVEVIYYDNPDAKEISTFISTRKVKRFDFDKVEIIGVLGEDKLADFQQDLAKVEVWGGWIHSNSPFDICLRLKYSNGEFDVVSPEGENGLPFFARFDSKGKLKKYVGMLQNDVDFYHLVSKYFSTKL